MKESNPLSPMAQPFCIVFACDNNYAIQTGVSIYSLFKNNTDLKLCVYILSDGIEEKYLLEYQRLAQTFHQELVIKPLPDYNKMAGVSMCVKGRFALSTYSTLFLEEVLPREVDRALWLDSDTIITGSLKELYTLDIAGFAAAMAFNIGVTSKRLHCFGRGEPYFNAGVVLFNFLYWKEHWVYNLILKEIKRRQGHSIGTDQSYLNTVLRGHIKKLSPKFNFMSDYLPALSDYNKFLRDNRYTKRDPKESLFDIQAANSDKRIIHTNQMTKENHPFFPIWQKYLSETVWWESPLPQKKKPISSEGSIKEALKLGVKKVGLYNLIRSIKLFFLLDVRPITKLYVRLKWGFWPPKSPSL